LSTYKRKAPGFSERLRIAGWFKNLVFYYPDTYQAIFRPDLLGLPHGVQSMPAAAAFYLSRIPGKVLGKVFLPFRGKTRGKLSVPSFNGRPGWAAVLLSPLSFPFVAVDSSSCHLYLLGFDIAKTSIK